MKTKLLFLSIMILCIVNAFGQEVEKEVKETQTETGTHYEVTIKMPQSETQTAKADTNIWYSFLLLDEYGSGSYIFANWNSFAEDLFFGAGYKFGKKWQGAIQGGISTRNDYIVDGLVFYNFGEEQRFSIFAKASNLFITGLEVSETDEEHYYVVSEALEEYNFSAGIGGAVKWSFGELRAGYEYGIMFEKGGGFVILTFGVPEKWLRKKK